MARGSRKKVRWAKDRRARLKARLARKAKAKGEARKGS